MVANINKERERMESLCESGEDVFGERPPEQRKAILDALQYFKNNEHFEVKKIPIMFGATTEIILPAIARTPSSLKCHENQADLICARHGFSCNILPVIRNVGPSPAMGVSYAHLNYPVADYNIRTKLPKRYIFRNASVFYAHLNYMVNKQPNGEEGHLITGSSDNLFYVIGIQGLLFIVQIARRLHDQCWFMDAFPISSEHFWKSGSRVFYPTAKIAT